MLSLNIPLTQEISEYIYEYWIEEKTLVEKFTEFLRVRKIMGDIEWSFDEIKSWAKLQDAKDFLSEFDD